MIPMGFDVAILHGCPVFFLFNKSEISEVMEKIGNHVYIHRWSPICKLQKDTMYVLDLYVWIVYIYWVYQ